MTGHSSFVVVAITHDEARVWNSGLDRDSRPERIHAPEHHERHLHTRKGQNNIEKGPSKDDVEIFESVALAVAGCQEILVIGHGKGKANHMVKMIQHWERKYPTTAKLVVGAIDSDLPRLTEPEILASARAWFDHFHEFGF